jgi:hypothetical protein
VIYTCCDKNRRAAVDAHDTLNGIDWLEVVDSGAPEESPRQRILIVRFLKEVPGSIDESNIQIEGGERIRGIHVSETVPATDAPVPWYPLSNIDDADHKLLVLTDRSGDFSEYRLRIMKDRHDDNPPDGFDPLLVEIPFSFKAECASDFDCKPIRTCEKSEPPAPDIDYLVKDYSGFRRLMLDRLTRLIPGWRERTPADLAVVLTEVLAETADRLSYWQDAVATEAYLETARLRTSLRRHALLVDYRMHEGCNARTWIHMQVNANGVSLNESAPHFLTKVPGAKKRIQPDSSEESDALQENPLRFEPMEDAVLYKANNTIYFYTWGDERCCLPQGATSATFRDVKDDPNSRLRLRPGDVLIFEEQVGPHTGEPEDADPRRRHCVRLTRVLPEAELVLDEKGNEIDRTPKSLRLDPLTAGSANEQAIVEVWWDQADALPFPLCLSSVKDKEHGGGAIDEVSIALGNIVPADHGETVVEKDFAVAPEAYLQYPPDRDASRCDTAEPKEIPPRFRPALKDGPLTWFGNVSKTEISNGKITSSIVPIDSSAGAMAALSWDMSRTLPAILILDGDNMKWYPKSDLLQSGPTDTHFVVEAEHDGTCRLRFGDGDYGKRPNAGESFSVTYRIGNGIAGNIGADAIAHVVTTDGRIDSVRNPMPAQGGTDPESAAQVRRRAPQAFRTQERAVTPEDYAAVTERISEVQRAAASLRWTGSWHTVFITVDQKGGADLKQSFQDKVKLHVDRFRMAGHDLRVDQPKFVSLEIDMLVCVDEEYFRSNVRQGLLEILGSGELPDNRRGIFHPDNFTFGQTVYLSPIYAAARQVPGVASVEITRFQRAGQDDPKLLTDGYLTLGSLEIARLDNDPNFPEHGVLRLDLHGGK